MERIFAAAYVFLIVGFIFIYTSIKILRDLTKMSLIRRVSCGALAVLVTFFPLWAAIILGNLLWGVFRLDANVINFWFYPEEEFYMELIIFLGVWAMAATAIVGIESRIGFKEKLDRAWLIGLLAAAFFFPFAAIMGVLAVILIRGLLLRNKLTENMGAVIKGVFIVSRAWVVLLLAAFVEMRLFHFR
jgi:hypothetical protein